MSRNREQAPSVCTFRPVDRELLVQGHRLAEAYGISLNKLLTFLLENAVQEWAVPGMEVKARPEDEENSREEEKTLT